MGHMPLRTKKSIELQPINKEKFIPKTALGFKLISLRKRAIDFGMRLLDENEILEEISNRRGESELDEKTNVH